MTRGRGRGPRSSALRALCATLPCCLLLLLLVQASIAAPAASAAPTLPRGVRPSRARFYEKALESSSASVTFRCLDGSGEPLPASRVNDDYCDCVDGSDEPGTSACPNGVFYCANLGSVPKLLNASAVDDGVCDCCDGSDEQVAPKKSSSSSPGASASPAPSSAARCPNTCAAEGAAAAAAARAAADAAAAGAAAREKAVAKARRERASWARSLSRLDADLRRAQEAAEALREAKEAAEKEDEREREEREKERRAREEEERKERAEKLEAAWGGGEAAKKPAAEEGAEPAAAADAAATDAVASAPAPAPEEATKAVETAEAAAGEKAPATATEEEEDPEEAGRRIASQWTHDPEAAAASSNPDSPEPAASVPLDSEHHRLHRHSDAQLTLGSAVVAGARGAVDRVVGFFARAAGKGKKEASSSSDSSSSPPSSSSSAHKHNETPRERAKRAFREAEAAARDLSEKRAKVEAKSRLDLGPDAAFASLLGECVAADVDKYTYNVCFFEGASQADRGSGGSSGSTTLLGSWAGWGTELPEVAPLPETENEKGEKITESEQDALTRAMLATKEGPDGALPERFYRTMRFADGQQCWNGPPRSLTLSVRCGKATRLSRVTEPSRCEYEAELETPAACDAEAVQEAARAAEEALAAARGVGAEGKDLRDEL